jgi:branched-chain amino acid transport system permease protein
MILMVPAFAALYRVVHSRLGRLFLALQQNEDLASSMGVNPLRIIC